MSKRSPAASAAKSFQRAMKAFTTPAVRAGTRALRQVLRQAARPLKTPARRAPAAPPGDWLAGVAFGAAGARRYHLFRPPQARQGVPVPLVVMLHGCKQNAAEFAAGTGMNRLAAKEGFCVLYPEQDVLAHPQGCWNWYETRSGRAQAEASLLMAAIDQVTTLYRVDPRRVAVAGLSAGGCMAALLASRYPARFAAVALHSGVAPGAAESSATALRTMRTAQTPEPLPVPAAGAPLPPLLVIHGSADGVVAFRNAEFAARLWAAALDAEAGPARPVRRGKRHPITVTDFKHRGRLAATLCEVSGLGHAWSGGSAGLAYNDPNGPDASRLIWAFAARRFRALPAAQPARPAA